MLSPRPRILFISPIAPYPEDIGVKIRVRNMLLAASRIGEVDFVGYSIDSTDDVWPHQEMLDDISSLCRLVRICKHPPWRGIGRREWFKAIRRHVFSSVPTMYSDFPREPLLSMVEPLAHSADLIWIERLYVAHWFQHYGSKIIVDVDDRDSVKLDRQIPFLSSEDYPRLQRIHQLKLAKAEKKATGRFARLVVCSNEDYNSWPEQERDRIWVVPNGADDRLFNYPRQAKVNNRLIFVGTMDYFPNIDAVQFFCQEILPLLAKEVPDITLHIVGKNPPESVLCLQADPHVTVVANVPDVAPYVQQAQLSVVPLRVGGGTRLKILESLALGTPVVSTRIGAEGLELLPNKDIVLADSPQDLTSAIIRLLRDPAQYSSLAEQGYLTTQARYRWTQIQNQVGTYLHRILQDRPRKST